MSNNCQPDSFPEEEVKAEYDKLVARAWITVPPVFSATREQLSFLWGGLMVADVYCPSGKRVLMVNRKDPSENGIYVVKNRADWEKDPEGDRVGSCVFVEDGLYSGMTFYRRASGWSLTPTETEPKKDQVKMDDSGMQDKDTHTLAAGTGGQAVWNLVLP